MQDRIYKWLDDRFGLDDIIGFMKKKTVPLHGETVWYYLGGVTLFLFFVQVATGVMLLFYYRTGADQSYESLQYIVSKVPYGWQVRNVHSWGANVMIFTAFVHMFSVYFTKAYRKPRELTWITGMALLLLAMTFGFSGYLLPWNELSFFATKVGTDIAGAVPIVGEPMLKFLRGGTDVTAATLSRFFGIHVAVLPGVFTLILGLHLFQVQRQGMSEPMSWKDLPEDKKKTMKFFPNFAMRDLVVWLIFLNILGILAVFFPWDLGLKADAFAPAPAGIKPEWYFMFMFQTLKFIPAHILFLEGEQVGILAFGFAGLIWFLVPFLDKRAQRNEKSRGFTWIGIFVVAFIVILTILGYAME